MLPSFLYHALSRALQRYIASSHSNERDLLQTKQKAHLTYAGVMKLPAPIAQLPNPKVVIELVTIL